MVDNGTEEALIDELRRLHDALGVPPRTVDMGRHGRFSPALYADLFGSWDEALEAAGIDGEPRRPSEDAAENAGVAGTVSDDGSVHDGRRERDGAEGEDGEREVDEGETEDEGNGVGERGTKEEEGEDDGTEGKNGAGEAGEGGRGNERDEADERDEKDEGLDAVRRCNDRVEGDPTPDDLRERGYSVNAVLEEHGTWKEVLEAAGLETEYVDRSPTRRRGEEEKLLDDVCRYSNLYDRRPSEEDLRGTEWMPSPEEYREAFGGVGKAVAEAVDGDDRKPDTEADELVSEVRRYYLRQGDVPDADDVRATEWMSSVEEYREAFGDMRGAVEASGVDGG
jgi:hypothetical protein